MPLWWNGRHSTLKMSWAQARAGSSPTSGNSNWSHFAYMAEWTIALAS